MRSLIRKYQLSVFILLWLVSSGYCLFLVINGFTGKQVIAIKLNFISKPLILIHPQDDNQVVHPADTNQKQQKFSPIKTK